MKHHLYVTLETVWKISTFKIIPHLEILLNFCHFILSDTDKNDVDGSTESKDIDISWLLSTSELSWKYLYHKKVVSLLKLLCIDIT